MRLSDVSPIAELTSLLKVSGVSVDIHEGGAPTAKLPDVYIEIMQNGGIKTKSSTLSISNGVLMVSIHVKLLSGGDINTTRSKIELSKFDLLFENNKTIRSGSYSYSLDPDNLVFEGRGLSEGYSSKVINVLFTKY